MRITTKACQPELSWQQILAQGFSLPSELLKALDIQALVSDKMLSAHQQFRTRVPRGFVARMQPGNIHDPLLRQVLPLDAELETQDNYTLDPLQEQHANLLPGLLHKYHGRVLLVVTEACAVNCRYCFRRHFPYRDNLLDTAALQQIMHYLRADNSIHEVIYSGGDPLLWSDEKLQQLTQQIATIPHITTLRIHTRLPVVLPERITEGFIQLLKNSGLNIVMVIHSNHPNEIDDTVGRTLLRLRQHNVTMLNQSVLLSGVNDQAEILAQLSQRLFSYGTLPYYLHRLDPVQGAMHFAVAEGAAHAIYQTLQASLPGYLVPKYVTETAGTAHKVMLS